MFKRLTVCHIDSQDKCEFPDQAFLETIQEKNHHDQGTDTFEHDHLWCLPTTKLSTLN